MARSQSGLDAQLTEQPDYVRLFRELLPPTARLLETATSFAPMLWVLGVDGTLRQLAVDSALGPGDAPDDRDLVAAAAREAIKGTIVAAVIVSHIRYYGIAPDRFAGEPDPGHVAAGEAICLDIDHCDSGPISLYHGFMGAGGDLKFADTIMSRPARAFAFGAATSPEASVTQPE